ncbi:hypothetical protein DN168_17655 [Salmonella enterica subsp. enterica serovar Eastbourne]|nr:hypothetical protein [Salmonella enterica subsp. enterica serovar Eastbourne]
MASFHSEVFNMAVFNDIVFDSSYAPQGMHELWQGQRSLSRFIAYVAELEGELLAIRAFRRCGIPGLTGSHGVPVITFRLVSIARLLGYACMTGAFTDGLFEKYIAGLILLGEQIDPRAWNFGFNEGLMHFDEMRSDDEASEEQRAVFCVNAEYIA